MPTNIPFIDVSLTLFPGSVLAYERPFVVTLHCKHRLRCTAEQKQELHRRDVVDKTEYLIKHGYHQRIFLYHRYKEYYADPMGTYAFSCSPSAFRVGSDAFTTASSASASLRDLLLGSRNGLITPYNQLCFLSAENHGKHIPLSNSHSTMPRPLSNMIIIKCRCVECTPIIPDREIVLILPLEPHL